METDEEGEDAIKRVLSRLADGPPVDSRPATDADDDDDEDDEATNADCFSSQLNQGRRIDFVLQVSLLNDVY